MAQIPTESRRTVRDRQRGLCFRCMMPGAQVHHRRRRGIVDEHTHCPCNLVLLCPACHGWVHGHPNAATTLGLIVSVGVEVPGDRPMLGFDGWWSADCTGRMGPYTIPVTQ